MGTTVCHLLNLYIFIYSNFSSLSFSLEYTACIDLFLGNSAGTERVRKREIVENGSDAESALGSPSIPAGKRRPEGRPLSSQTFLLSLFLPLPFSWSFYFSPFPPSLSHSFSPFPPVLLLVSLTFPSLPLPSQSLIPKSLSPTVFASSYYIWVDRMRRGENLHRGRFSVQFSTPRTETVFLTVSTRTTNPFCIERPSKPLLEHLCTLSTD